MLINLKVLLAISEMFERKEEWKYSNKQIMYIPMQPVFCFQNDELCLKA